MPNYTDAHLHLCKNLLSMKDSLDNSENSFFENAFLNATALEDWKEIFKLSQNPHFVPFYGVHPWRIDTLTENDQGWILELANWISFSLSFIGEIGLDRVTAKKHPQTHSLEKQLYVFRSQLELACEFQRGCSLHVVHADDIALKEIKRVFPKPRIPIILHGFQGNIETAHQWIRQGAFLSFGPRSLISDKTREVLISCPRQQLLLESDAEGIYQTNVIEELYTKVSTLLHTDTQSLIQEVNQNASIFKNSSSAR